MFMNGGIMLEFRFLGKTRLSNLNGFSEGNSVLATIMVKIKLR